MKLLYIIFFMLLCTVGYAQDINKVTVYLEEGERGKDSYASIKSFTVEYSLIKFTESYTGKYKNREGKKINCELTDDLKKELKNLVIKNDFLKNTVEIFNILPPASYKKIKINIESSQGNFRTEFEGVQFDYRTSETKRKIEPLLDYLQNLYLNANLKCKTE